MPRSVFDFPYPWNEPAARNLHRTLVELYPAVKAAEMVASEAGIETTEIDLQQNARLVWYAILNLAARGGITRTLVEQVRDATGVKNPRRAFLDALLTQEQNAPLDAEPLDQDGAPHFIRGTDDVTVPEAHLFHDDLTIYIEADVVRLMETLGAMLRLARSVCLIRAQTAMGTQVGTGFRVGPNLLISNHHVVHDKLGNLAGQISAEFDYQSKPDGDGMPTKMIRCNAAETIAESKYDWALLQTIDPLDAEWPIIDLKQSVAPVKSEGAFIIQHPMGNRKALGFVRNQVTGVDEEVVHYLTDTLTGSSGSPVFNAKGQLIALHHAGGRPQEMAGRMPMKKNEGIRISQIIAGLANKGIVLP